MSRNVNCKVPSSSNQLQQQVSDHNFSVIITPMMKLEDLKSFCLSLLERLDSKVDDEYSENDIQEVSRFCSQLAKYGAEMDERFPDLMDRMQQHFFKMFLCVDHVHFFVR